MEEKFNICYSKCRKESDEQGARICPEVCNVNLTDKECQAICEDLCEGPHCQKMCRKIYRVVRKSFA